MRKNRSHVRNNSRWDLFLLLNIPPQLRGTRFLEPIPEEPPDFSEHRCHRESECNSPTDVEVGSHKNVTRITRCRRQWEISPENLQRVYRSLSNVDLRPQSHSKRDSNAGLLPPLKRVESREGSRRGSSKSLANKRMTGMVGDGNSKNEESQSPKEPSKNVSELRKHSNGKSNGIKDEQWVVMKPPRRKPIDLIKLEGPMELNTTSRSTYDAAAKEILNEMRKKSLLTSEKAKEPSEPIHLPTGVNVEGKVVGFQRVPIAPAKQRRPRTSLKAGGECDYSTINRESFKRFIVIDANNNVRVPIETHKFDILTLDPTLASNESTSLLPKVQGVDAKRDQTLELSDACAKGCAKSDITQGKNNDSIRTKRETASKKVNASQHELLVKQMLPQDLSQYPTDAINNRRNTTTDAEASVKILKDSHEVANKAVSSNSNTSIVNSKERKHEVNGSDNNAIESILSKGIAEVNKGDSKRIMDKSGNRERESRKSMTVKGIKSDRSRHLSLPRTKVTKHKNDSQLKFVGDMDFVTTSNSCYRDTTPMVHGHHCAQMNEKGLRRDLFRASTEIDLFKRRDENGPNLFNPTTTYSSQFQDKLHCPAIDLGNTSSDYTFKTEAGGHKFYYTMK